MKKLFSAGMAICFLVTQLTGPIPSASAADEVFESRGPEASAPVKSLESDTGDLFHPTVSKKTDSPLSKPAEPKTQKEMKAQDHKNESRDLEEYSFEKALEHLSSDYASAVIVKRVTARDLRQLVDLKIEVGIAVLKGKIVLFTSGNRDEMRLLPAAEELLKKASLVAHTHPRGEITTPSVQDIAHASEKMEYLISEKGVLVYNQKGLQDRHPRDYGFLAAEIQKLCDPKASTKQARDLLNAFIRSMDQYNEDRNSSVLFRAAPPTLSASALSSSDITPLPGNPNVTRVAPSGNTSSVGGTSRGLIFNYNTAGGWAGGGFTFDNFGTSTVETQDLSGYSELTFGLKGNPTQVKFEIISYENNQEKKASVYLTGIQTGTEKIWGISTATLAAAGLNLAKVRMILFIVEGSNLSGSLEVNRIPTPVMIAPSTSLKTADLTSLGKPTIAELGITSIASVSSTSRGFKATYTTTSAQPYAGVGFAMNGFSSTMNLNSFSNLVFGVKGSASQLKVEIVTLVNGQEKKASVYLTGISPTTEQIFSIPTSKLTGIDLSKTKIIYFIAEGTNQTGSFEVNRLPSPTNLGTNYGPTSGLTQANVIHLPDNISTAIVKPSVSGSSVVIYLSHQTPTMRIDYNTGPGAWVGGGLRFFYPPGTENLSGLNSWVFGLKGNPSQVKLEIVDSLGNKASTRLTGIRNDIEQFWSGSYDALCRR